MNPDFNKKPCKPRHSSIKAGQTGMIVVCVCRTGLVQEANNETVFHGNNLVGVASIAIVTAEAKGMDQNNYNSADSFI
jgi:hypothetical protein